MKRGDEIQSMTGFGSAETGAFTIEIRSVNHRYMEAFFRMPSFLGRLEIELRKSLKNTFAKGRFDVNIQVRPERSQVVKANTELAAGLIGSLEEIKERFSLGGEITIGLVSGFRDILITDSAEIGEEELFDAFEKALVMLREMRETEGKNIRAKLLDMLDVVAGYLDGIRAESENLHEKLRERFLKKFQELVRDYQLDQGRLIQEASIMAERADISEEIVRLQSHLKQFRDIIQKGGVVGRKLDFLLQEFFREANTIASKTMEYGIVSTIVDMKNEIEKLREQVQNLQ